MRRVEPETDEEPQQLLLRKVDHRETEDKHFRLCGTDKENKWCVAVSVTQYKFEL